MAILTIIIIFIAICIVIRIVLIRKYHKISKKAQSLETITKSEYEFWRKHYAGLCLTNTYEEYLRISLNISERKLDIPLKTKLIETAKDNWKQKSLFANLAYFLKYEDCELP